jgi:hypothetical protein
MMPLRAIVNVESALGLALTLAIVLIRRKEAKSAPIPHEAAWIACILLLATACLARALPFYFLSDEFVLLGHARIYQWSHLRYGLTHAGGDGFFRPLVYAWQGLEARWAGVNPVWWHISGLAIHLAIAWLVYRLARRLYPGTQAPLWAAALFALHASHVEPVSYMAANFDLLATLFVVAGLLLFLRYCETRAIGFMAASLACQAAALLSKESAYVFPPLAMLLAWRRARLRVTFPWWILAAAMFVYRWRLLGGIGGYRDPATGAPQVWQLSAIGVLKALALRIWAVFYFPVNWSVSPEPWLWAALAAAVGTYLWLARRGAGFDERRRWLVPLGFILIASLPVLHLLLIGADLNSSAHLYLPSIGFCLLLGLLVDRRVIAGALLLAFQVAALEHNLAVWGDVAALARQTCASAASGAPVRDLPRAIHGVHFFANGFRQCVAFEAAPPR